MSVVNTDNLDSNSKLGQTITVNFLDEYLAPASTDDLMGVMKDVMTKSVTVVTGFEPFKFVCMNKDAYLFGENPNVADLINNAKGV